MNLDWLIPLGYMMMNVVQKPDTSSLSRWGGGRDLRLRLIK